MALLGYGRVSSKSQNADRQVEALKNYGVPLNNIFLDVGSGKNFERPGYRQMFGKLKYGDTLVIKSIDRLGRCREELMEEWQKIKKKGVYVNVIDQPILNTDRQHDLFSAVTVDIVLQLLSAFAQSEREAIHQRQAEGIAVAKSKGKKFGRPPISIPDNFVDVYEDWTKKKISSRQAANILGVSQDTFLRWKKNYPAPTEK